MKLAGLIVAAMAAPAWAGGEFFDDFSQKDLDAHKTTGWVLRTAGETLSPDAMQARAEQLRKQGVARQDTVPDAGLISECNL